MTIMTQTTVRALVLTAITWLGWLALFARAYIPAQPINITTAIQAGINIQPNTSTLELQWYPNASFSQNTSYQLAGAETTGTNMGALVHFSELNDTNDYTTTPWIALISCDTNGTNPSKDNDIFTLAHQRGAVAALLYSEWSDACLINAEYADPATNDQVFDIFSVQSHDSSKTIANAFTNVNQTLYGDFNATMLNQTLSVINNTISTGQVPEASYLFATLTAANATDSDGGGNSSSDSSNSNSGNGGNTDLAMIVLYVITGAVSVLFCIVILSGAIRAIRHPERYGPRPSDPTMGEYGQGQSRARGITRAILDTFPVIKFSPSPVDPRAPAFGGFTGTSPKLSDVESGTGSEPALEMNQLSAAQGKGVVRSAESPAAGPADGLAAAPLASISVSRSPSQDEDVSSPGAGPSRPPVAQPASGPDEQAASAPLASPLPRPRGMSGSGTENAQVMPAAIGRETCPICIIDFEEGDDIRVLPCEGKHVFHQQCVDQWLLELSSSCPICRHDFHALEEMIAGSTDGHDEHSEHDDGHERRSAHLGSRFSRYLRFARGRRGHHGHRQWGNRDSIIEDPTDPPYPLASESTL
ncbi:hypothetical protein M0805_000703 [Coniferiporia weirii]|nr:hypothetical protein M0805_000703 [Coniferiporia weirii]